MEPIKFIEPEFSDAPETELIEPEIVDAELAVPAGHSCQSCAAPLDPDDQFCPACGKSSSAEKPSTQDPSRKLINCKNCGSTIQTDRDRRSYRCSFCDSTYVVELEPDQTGRQNPEFVIGFAVSREQAKEKFRHWIQDNAWFRPADLKNVDLPEKISGVYLPFWSFSMLAESNWSASIGEYWYRTETYTTTENGKTVTRTRTVTETEWWPLSGNFHQYYSGHLISASPGLPQEVAAKVMPFDLPAMKRFEPYFLAGWESEEYNIDRQAALDASKKYYHACQRQNVSRFMPGDTHQSLEVSTWFSRVNSDLCLLPYHLLTYRYQDRLYRFLVNGQTGRVWGNKPFSPKRIMLVILLVIVALAAIVGGVVLFQSIFAGVQIDVR